MLFGFWILKRVKLKDVTNNNSVCSGGIPVDYYWRQCVSSHHIFETVQKLMGILYEKYHLNEYKAAYAEAQFYALLEKATQGKLVPIDHVKQISRSPDVDMYEIRWNDIEVRLVDKVTGMYGDSCSIMMRLYYFELGELWVVGLRCHEKLVGATDDETRNQQNEQIDCAIECFWETAQDRWGIPELEEALLRLPSQY